MQAPSIETVFDPRRNSLNAIRLVLALLVVVSHAWPLNGLAGEPALGGLSLGTWAVVGFFAISSFLITRSRIRARRASEFWIARFLRIFPGALVALILVAFVFAPISTAIQPEAEWHLNSALTFVLRNVLLYPPGVSQAGIDDTLVGFRFREWDGPLWTLFWEGICYALIGVAVSVVGSRRLLNHLVLTSLVLSTGLLLFHDITGRGQDLPVRVLPLIAAFAAGATLALNASRIPINWVTIGASIALLSVGIGSNVANALSQIPFAFLLIVLAIYAPLSRVGSTYDVSYGVYIYAWPVQQLIALTRYPSNVSVVVTIAAVITLTLPFAYLSCRFVEKPALTLRRKAHGVNRPTSRSAPETG